MPPPTSSPKLNTGITIDGKIKALADLVATHERRTFASLVEHAIWLYVQKRLPPVEIERVLTLLSKPKSPASASPSPRGGSTRAARSPVKRAQLPEAPALVKRREKSQPKAKTPSRTKAKKK